MLTSTGTIGSGLVLAGGLGSLGGDIAISAIGELALVGIIAMTGISAFGASCIMMFAKISRQTGKVTSSNKTSWVNNESIIHVGNSSKNEICYNLGGISEVGFTINKKDNYYYLTVNDDNSLIFVNQNIVNKSQRIFIMSRN